MKGPLHCSTAEKLGLRFRQATAGPLATSWVSLPTMVVIRCSRVTGPSPDPCLVVPMGTWGLDITGMFYCCARVAERSRALTMDRFFASSDGTEMWNVYHATKTPGGACDGSRYTMAQRVNWNADGTPNFGRAPSLQTNLQGPSGE